MQEDTWTNTTTRAEYGVSGPLGSPRGWLRRALDEPTLTDTTFADGSLTQTEISVAGIWYKKPEGYGLPVTAMHRELFRWFEIPEPQYMLRHRNTQLVPAIGLCAAVPMHEVMRWLKVYESHGAAYLWWKRPTNTAMRAVGEGLTRRRVLDHHRVYELLEQGKTTTEIGRLLDFPEPNISYVQKKWRNGVELQPRKTVDHAAVLREHAGGASVEELAQAHDTSKSYIYRIIGRAK